MRIIKNEKAKTATIIMYGEIRQYRDNLQNYTQEFAATLMELEAEKFTTLFIRLNSSGGSVQEGNAIWNSIRSSKMRTVALVDGIAASMAGILLFAFDVVEVAANSRGMLHGVRGGSYGTSEQLRLDAELMDSMTEDFIRVASEKMPFTAEEIREKIKKDWWLTAQQMVDYGIASKIYNGVVQMETPDGDDLQAIYNRFQARLVAVWDNSKTSNEEIMYSEIFKKSLGLEASATDTEVEAKVKELQAKANEAETLVAQIEAQQNAHKKALIDAAIQERKILAKDRDVYDGMAANIVERVLGTLQPQMKPSSIINQQNSGGGSDNEKITNWKELVAKGDDFFERFKAENVGEYSKLYFSEFGFPYVS